MATASSKSKRVDNLARLDRVEADTSSLAPPPRPDKDSSSPAPNKAKGQESRPPWLRGADTNAIDAGELTPVRPKNSDVESGQEKDPVPPPEDWRPKQSAKGAFRCRGCRTICSAYRNLLRSKPLRASCITAMIVMCLGDAGAQLIEWRLWHWYPRNAADTSAPEGGGGAFGVLRRAQTGYGPDLRRTVLMASYSASVFTPIYFGLYTLMERMCSTGPTLSVVRHSLFVLAAGAPGDALLLVVAPYAEQLVLSTPATREEANALAAAKLRDDVPRLMRATLCFWGSFNVLNFWLMPPGVHLLSSSIASVCWNTYLSYIAHEHLNPNQVAFARKRSADLADEEEIVDEASWAINRPGHRGGGQRQLRGQRAVLRGLQRKQRGALAADLIEAEQSDALRRETGVDAYDAVQAGSPQTQDQRQTGEAVSRRHRLRGQWSQPAAASAPRVSAASAPLLTDPGASDTPGGLIDAAKGNGLASDLDASAIGVSGGDPLSPTAVAGRSDG